LSGQGLAAEKFSQTRQAGGAEGIGLWIRRTQPHAVEEEKQD
jgi:hypothetical protein